MLSVLPAITHPSACLSVCLSVTLVDQTKTVAVRIIKFSPYGSSIHFLQFFDTVGWVFWPVKTVSHATYSVLAGT